MSRWYEDNPRSIGRTPLVRLNRIRYSLTLTMPGTMSLERDKLEGIFDAQGAAL